MRSVWFKMSNCKIPRLKFCRFFTQSVAKTMGKTAILAILYFSLHPPLYNVEEQWVKLVTSNVMGSQYCIGGEGKF